MFPAKATKTKSGPDIKSGLSLSTFPLFWGPHPESALPCLLPLATEGMADPHLWGDVQPAAEASLLRFATFASH